MQITKKHYSDEGHPSTKIFSNLQLNDTYTDLLTGEVFRCSKPSSPITWTAFNNAYGAGIPGPQGEPGPMGPPGSGSSFHITVTPNGVDDTTNLQAAIDLQRTTKRPIQLAGVYRVSRVIVKSDHSLIIDGGVLNSITNNPIAIIDSDVPTDTANAEIFVERSWQLTNMRINANPGQICIAPGPTKGSLYQRLHLNGGQCGFLGRFSLNTIFSQCEFAGQPYGAIVAHGGVLPYGGTVANYGTWSNATVSNSCSNVTSFIHCRAYSHTTLEQAFTAYASDAVTFYECITEGIKYKKCYVFDAAGSTTAKRGVVNSAHYECITASIDPVNEALVWCRAPSFSLRVIDPMGHYALTMVNAGATVGTVTVIVDGNQWWVPVSGKWFYNADKTFWDLINLENFGNSSSVVPGTFSGVPVSKFEGERKGYTLTKTFMQVVTGLDANKNPIFGQAVKDIILNTIDIPAEGGWNKFRFTPIGR